MVVVVEFGFEVVGLSFSPALCRLTFAFAQRRELSWASEAS